MRENAYRSDGTSRDHVPGNGGQVDSQRCPRSRDRCLLPATPNYTRVTNLPSLFLRGSLPDKGLSKPASTSPAPTGRQAVPRTRSPSSSHWSPTANGSSAPTTPTPSPPATISPANTGRRAVPRTRLASSTRWPAAANGSLARSFRHRGSSPTGRPAGRGRNRGSLDNCRGIYPRRNRSTTGSQTAATSVSTSSRDPTPPSGQTGLYDLEDLLVTGGGHYDDRERRLRVSPLSG